MHASRQAARRSRPRRSTLRRRARAAPPPAAAPDPPAPCDKRPVAPCARLELDHDSFAPVVRRDELLFAREHELDRTAGGTRKRGDVTLEMEVAFRSEPAAEQRNDHTDVR